MVACHIKTFPVINFTNKASDVFKAVIGDVKAGYEDNVHPKLFELYKDNYHKGLAMFGEPEPGSKYFELNEKFKLNTARLATYKSYKVTGILKDLPGKDFDKNSIQVLKNFNRYQATEYNAIVARARSAKQFIDFQQDADLYPNMEWIMTRSADPREEHLVLVGTIRPINDPFWNENQPGNLWNCKCDWEPTDKDVTEVPKQEVIPATGLDGNPAMTGELITDEHPYISKAGDIISEIKTIAYSDTKGDFTINVLAHKEEIADNVATARILVNNYPDMKLTIREHLHFAKNPEYEINSMIADAKRIKGYKGITSGFISAKKQGCEVVIIDFNKHFKVVKPLDANKIKGRILWRENDFIDGSIKKCYMIFGDKSILITQELLKTKELFSLIKGLNP